MNDLKQQLIELVKVVGLVSFISMMNVIYFPLLKWMVWCLGVTLIIINGFLMIHQLKAKPRGLLYECLIIFKRFYAYFEIISILYIVLTMYEHLPYTYDGVYIGKMEYMQILLFLSFGIMFVIITMNILIHYLNTKMNQKRSSNE